jgi:hypothetical protein
LETPESLIIRRVKRDSAEFAILQNLNIDEIRHDPWNPAPNLLYAAERGDDAILCFERLFGCDNPPLQTVANVIDYIRQALEVMTFNFPAQPFCPVAAPAGPAMLTNISGTMFSSRAQDRTLRVWRPEGRDDGHRSPEDGRL